MARTGPLLIFMQNVHALLKKQFLVHRISNNGFLIWSHFPRMSCLYFLHPFFIDYYITTVFCFKFQIIRETSKSKSVFRDSTPQITIIQSISHFTQRKTIKKKKITGPKQAFKSLNLPYEIKYLSLNN